MYKIELLEKDNILRSKELSNYESTFSCLNGLIKYLINSNRKIIIYKKSSGTWVKFGEWKLQ